MSEEPVWSLCMVHSQEYRYEKSRTFVVDGITFVCEKNNVEHTATFRFDKCTEEEVTRETFIFSYKNSIRERNVRNLTYDEFDEILEHFRLPDLTNFEMINPYFSHFSYNMYLERRTRGIVYKTYDLYTIRDQNMPDLAHFAMDIYDKNRRTMHHFKNALSCDSDEDC